MSPRRRARPPGRMRYEPVDVFSAKVVSVNAARWSVTLVDENNGVHEDVRVNPQYLSSGGTGAFAMPETGSMVWLMRPSTSAVPFIFASQVRPQQLDAGDDFEDPSDARQNRPVIDPGDQVLGTTRGGGFAILRRSGVLEFGASEFAKRVCIPLRNTIRDYFENYYQHAAGGEMSWQARREDDQHGTARVPVEFKLDIKEFTDQAPSIKLRLGRIAEEDAQSIPQGQLGAIVASLNINDRFRLWIDRDGCVASTVYGAQTHSNIGPVVDYYDTAHTRRVRGKLLEHFGDRTTTVDHEDRLVVAGDASSEVRGNRRVVVAGEDRRSVGGNEVEQVDGEAQRSVSANQSTAVGGNHDLVVGGGASESIGGPKTETVNGPWVVTVMNKDKDTLGLDVRLLQGKGLLHGADQSMTMSIGKLVDSPVARVELKPDGTVKVESAMGQVQLEMNSTGVKIDTPGGAIILDQAGSVQLGPAGAAGAVVTTLSHPVDFVTGIPIKGAAQVSAGGAPSPVAVPPSFSSTG